MLEAEVVVIGSGHAGIEAALASARLGCDTLILTQNLDTIGQMSCNPAIGGSAKSQIVKEIDALGGAMGVNADATGIQFRLLNRSKGAAVWATRVQCDKKAYQFRLKALLERTANLRILQGTALRILQKGDCVIGIEIDLGVTISAAAIVVTAGTFLRGLLHVGDKSMPGGRMADAPSGLSANLRQLGLQSGRFKTGTPCRLNQKSVDFSSLKPQFGDRPVPRFSSVSVRKSPDDVFTLNFDSQGVFHVEQIPCWFTHTTFETAEIISSNLHRSPLYQGQIEGIGPRYCPSIEDKIVRFPARTSHPIFLEPEGRHSEELYVNGVSTSLPYDVQLRFIRSIPGLRKAEIVRPGYAVEYDYFPPTQLKSSLETKKLSGLFLAGQVNGTSGYEEAAGQGLIAGVNAALKARSQPEFILSSDHSYIGVLLEDLTTRGTDEPYRMFTSRAVNRLSLREDNADLRLTELGATIGLVDESRISKVHEKKKAIARLNAAIRSIKLDGRPLDALMRSPTFGFADLPEGIRCFGEEAIWQHIFIEARYSGYIARQQTAKPLSAELSIPEDLDFSSVPGLRNETREKLRSTRPGSLRAAGRIPGLTTTDLSILAVWLHNRR
jgi:tRNA uridine 5-carboxymethylaminomethyl modification enzyme